MGESHAPRAGPNPRRTAFLDGELVPEGEGVRATLRAAARSQAPVVYDAARTFAGAPLKLEAHVARLYRGLLATRIDPGMAPQQMVDASISVLEANRRFLRDGEEYSLVQMVSTPDPSALRSRTRGNVLIYCRPLSLRQYASSYLRGASVVSTATNRRQRGGLFQPQKRAASDPVSDSFERMYRDPSAFQLMLDSQGYVLECRGATFLIVSGGRIRVPDRRTILSRVSLETVLELAAEARVPVVESSFSLVDVYEADEVFMAATSFCVLPVRTVDGNRIGMGAPGRVAMSLLGAWSRRVGIDIVEQALGQLAGRAVKANHPSGVRS